MIDIGSNSIRLVVFERQARCLLQVFNEKVMSGLGRGFDETGRLNPEGVASALTNLPRFVAIATAMGVTDLIPFATAAVRDAADGPAFLRELRERAGLEVRLLSGDDEARLSALGVASAVPGTDGIVGDLGGGSLELVSVQGMTMSHHESLPLGAFRLMRDGKAKAETIIASIDRQLDRLPWLDGFKGRTFYPVGGTWRAFARAHMERVTYPLHVIHHYAIDGADAAETAALLGRLGRKSKIKGAPKRRLEALPYGALVLSRLLLRLAPPQVVFSAYGLREGHLLSLLSPDLRLQDPLLAAAEDWTTRFGRLSDPSQLFAWTAGLFAGEDDAAQRLRQAACTLSDVGWVDHPDYRAEHAFLRILRFPFPAVDHAERAFLALCGYARYAGVNDGPLTIGARSLLSEAQATKALVLGLALRLAHTLTGGGSVLLQRTSLKLTGDSLTLTLPEDGTVPGGEVVQRRLDSLAKALDRRGELTVARPQAAE